MKKSTLLLDLDYTIFPTNTIDRKVIDPFFEHLLANISSLFSAATIEAIDRDLWRDSWDVVIDRYKIPKAIFINSVGVLETLPLQLEIATYPDYHFLKELSNDKFLVTTGMTFLQKAKIETLGIANDFKEIIINDRLKKTKTKVDIFQELIEKYNLVPENTYVIGDNPDSEIQAGNDLNLPTIQIVRDTMIKGSNAKYYIHSFEELKNIITQYNKF